MRATYIIESEHQKLHMACIEWKGVDRDWILADARLQTMRCYMLKLDMGHSYASAERNKAATKCPGRKLVYDDVFQTFLVEPRKAKSKLQRAQISKSIREHLRRRFGPLNSSCPCAHLSLRYKGKERIFRPGQICNFVGKHFASEIHFESFSLKT